MALHAWSRVLGTVYAFTENPEGRVPTLYVGMTAQVPWTKRISQHLYGRGGGYRNAPKPWADLVPGYRGGLREVLHRGGAYIVWQKQCFYWWLKVRESWAIGRLHPVHNYLENTDNPLRVSKWDAAQDREFRNLRAGVPPVRRTHYRTRVSASPREGAVVMGVQVRNGRVVKRYGPGWADKKVKR